MTSGQIVIFFGHVVAVVVLRGREMQPRCVAAGEIRVRLDSYSTVVWRAVHVLQAANLVEQITEIKSMEVVENFLFIGFLKHGCWPVRHQE